MSFLESDIARDLLGFVFGQNSFTAPAAFYIGLLDNGERELDANFEATRSYSRKLVATTDWTYASDTIGDAPGVGVKNTIPLIWTALMEDEVWRVKYVRIYSDATTDARIATLDLGPMVTYREGNTPYIPTGAIKLLSEFFE